VVAGLSKTPKSLPAKYMFDDVGARLFACLTSQSDHPLAKNERAILEPHAADIAETLGERIQLVDLACGDGSRAELLASALRSPARVVLVDRLAGAAVRASSVLAARHGDLPVVAIDAHSPWGTRLPACASASRTVAYLPSSIIGELEPRDARTELAQLAGSCGRDGALLVGLDLKRDAKGLEAAYSDRASVSASLGLNLLARINRELRGGFQLAAFDHRAVYDAAKGRVEMQLVSKRWQWAAVHNQWFNFGAGETVTTMVAYKYTIEWFSAVAAAAGWKLDRVFLAPDRTYALVLLRT